MTIKLHQMLGLAEAPSNGFAWHDRIMEGLPARSMRTLASCLGVTQRQLAELAMPGTPFHRKMTLSPEIANFLYRVALAQRLVTPSLQNSMKRAANWLRNPNAELRGRIPILLLQTHTGAEFVFTAISRMKPELVDVTGYAKAEGAEESEEPEVAELQ
jgi:putative toxin-antitoxin system antitoxin component (TIGR02293 family)